MEGTLPAQSISRWLSVLVLHFSRRLLQTHQHELIGTFHPRGAPGRSGRTSFPLSSGACEERHSWL